MRRAVPVSAGPEVRMRAFTAAGALAIALASAGALACAGPAVPPLSHVIVVVMENKAYDEVRWQPFTASAIKDGVVFSRSFAAAHPSQPNYLALWAASTMDIGDDDCPPAGAPYRDENLGHACEQAGLTWRSYAEDLPAAGSDTCIAFGRLYTRKHNPWTNYSNIDHSNERPFSDLAADLANGTLPNLAFISPNNCHNSHDRDCTALDADDWLSHHLPPMIKGVGPRGLVIVTWDEDDYSDNNHVLTFFNGPMLVPGEDSIRVVTHFTVVRTICEALGIPSFANADADSAITGVWRPDPALAAKDSTSGPWLGAPYPNPASGRVFTRLRLTAPASVTATVFDPTGRRIREIAHGRRVGDVALEWTGRDSAGHPVPPGVYVLSVNLDGRELERKVFRLQ